MSHYLKPNIQVDPLFNQWYAWNLLVPPVTAAVNMLERHLKMMTSFVKSPAMHAAALKNPAMRGGLFIDLDASRVGEVVALLERTQSECGHLLDFARAIAQLTKLLQEHAKGMAMESLYAQIPEPLQGYVELCYDLSHTPSFRVLEALLYKSRYYAQELQSVALSETTADRTRPFMLSTPLFPGPKTVSLPVPFADPRLDALFRMKRTPQPLRAIADLFGGMVSESQWQTLLTTQAPPPAPRYDGDGIRVRYMGHATLLIESRDVTILTDPIISYSYGAEPARFTFDDLPEHIDYILLTHSHHDHVHLETLLQLRHMTGQIIVPRNCDGFLHDPSLELALRHTGFTNVREVRDFDEIGIPGGRIIALPFFGEHHDLNNQSKSTYRVEVGGRSVMAVADAAVLDPKVYAEVERLYGKSEVLFLGMECEGAPASWIHGPMFTRPLTRDVDQSRRARGSNFTEGKALLDRFGFREVYVYAMGQEPWISHILDNELTNDSKALRESQLLIEYATGRGVTAEHLYGKKEIFV
mgnify:CR=1 FL=1